MVSKYYPALQFAALIILHIVRRANECKLVILMLFCRQSHFFYLCYFLKRLHQFMIKVCSRAVMLTLKKSRMWTLVPEHPSHQKVFWSRWSKLVSSQQPYWSNGFSIRHSASWHETRDEALHFSRRGRGRFFWMLSKGAGYLSAHHFISNESISSPKIGVLWPLHSFVSRLEARYLTICHRFEANANPDQWASITHA